MKGLKCATSRANRSSVGDISRNYVPSTKPRNYLKNTQPIGWGGGIPAFLLVSNLVKFRQDKTSKSSCHPVPMHDVGW